MTIEISGTGLTPTQLLNALYPEAEQAELAL